MEYGEWLENPMSVSCKMDRLLQICDGQRDKHIKWLRKKGDPRCSAEQPQNDYYMLFNEEKDMKTIMNQWRDDPHSYMKEDVLRRLKDMKPQEALQKKKSVFSTYLFQVAGCKWLIHQLLRFPVVWDPTQAPSSSAQRPAWKQLLRQFEEHRKSAAYCTAVEDSQRKGDDHVRLSQRMCKARFEHEVGKRISFRVRHEHLDWHSLTPDDQKLVEYYDYGWSAKTIQKLIDEKEKKGTAGFHLLRMTT